MNDLLEMIKSMRAAVKSAERERMKLMRALEAAELEAQRAWAAVEQNRQTLKAELEELAKLRQQKARWQCDLTSLQRVSTDNTRLRGEVARLKQRIRESGTQLPAVDRLDELAWLHDNGATAAEALTALGESASALQRLCFRHGERKLAAWLESEMKKDRSAA